MTVTALKARRDTEQSIVEQVFFGKDSVKVGDRLRFWGASDSGSRWRVSDIRSYRRRWTPDGWAQYDEQHTKTARYLHDTIEVTNTATGAVHALSFAYLRYSAIWWLTR